MRALGHLLGRGLLYAGLGWMGVLLLPDAIAKRQIPDFRNLSSDRRLAPASILSIAGFALMQATRPRPAPPKDDGDASAG